MASRRFTIATQPHCDERDDASLRRRPAEADAGAARDGVADDQFLYAPDPGLLGADRCDRAASRTAPARCASFRAAPSRNASSIASRPPMRIPTSFWPRRSPRVCGASRTASSPSRWSKATRTTSKFPERLALPRTLWDAAQRLKKSKMARDWFGDAFVEHFAATREWEEREFRKHITDWELARYFEII